MDDVWGYRDKVLYRKRQLGKADSYLVSDHQPASCRLEQARLEIMISDVFISYSSQNAIIADAINTILRLQELDALRPQTTFCPARNYLSD